MPDVTETKEEPKADTGLAWDVGFSDGMAYCLEELCIRYDGHKVANDILAKCEFAQDVIGRMKEHTDVWSEIKSKIKVQKTNA